jgi:membrane-associated protease RseP (regulator of RpoE activity)
MFAGAIQEAKSWDEFVGNFPHSMLKGIPFSFSLLSILLAHEMGHFIMSRKFGIRATLPHFIPVPHPLVGTFGAFIKMKSIIPDKKALLYIGAAGPLAGIMVAIPVTIYGLSISTPIPIPEGEGIFLGDPLLFKILSFIFAPPVPEGYTLQISTVAFAGWIGFFVTALNLLPFSQLDGGHIIYALLGEKSILISYMLFPFLILAGFTWPGWFFWAFLLLILGLRHPPTIDRITKPEKREKIIGIICIIVFILTFHPVPFKVQT